ncbi:chemotaxis-specific protein-glutamate methyltransferase CheB [Sulfurimonas sp. SAG-AH-194-C21]|nr:chemotaxis-specific protein-glutamate methyltransferase CheB [Sulfurimonas sp. SAG-AH-194-C21]MDF1882759.1 chemotaxis-specific protein-glutamate methyltransferase CheB [Sulfurimonas sp. SAG-AH-194-C21]
MGKSILIVDDSALVRKQLSEMIETLGFEIEFAKNGKEAVDKATSHQYDVITMDINMPIMDGIEAVSQIMQAQPTPILMVSSLTTEDATITMDALDLGAIDYIAKPGTMNVGKNENREEILSKVSSLSRISTRRLKRQMSRPPVRERRRTQSSSAETKVLEARTSKEIEKVVLIGSSTGGPGLIEQICSSLPVNFKHPVCIVQHMPEQFTAAFAQRLDRAAILPVLESKQNMELLPGHIYVARGGVHMHFAKKVSGKIVIREEKDKGASFFQPSVNEMMNSAAEVFECKNLVGVILTGIGDDGADAMVRIKKDGAYTIAESEESATVYGMPKEAYDRGGVSEQLSFKDILKKVSTLR